jgi:hypothetical protein
MVVEIDDVDYGSIVVGGSLGDLAHSVIDYVTSSCWRHGHVREPDMKTINENVRYLRCR